MLRSTIFLFSELQDKLKARAEAINETRAKLSQLEEEFSNLTCLFNDTTDELSSTKECLHQVNEILHNTQTKLRHIVEDRDGLQFLVETYKKTEDELYEKAIALLSIFEHASSDCDKLHSKLERKKAVEQHNAEHQTKFRKEFGVSIQNIENNLDTLTTQHSQKSRQLVQWIGTVHKHRVTS